MYTAMAVNVEPFSRIMAVVVLSVWVLLSFDWKVDFLLPFLCQGSEDESRHQKRRDDADKATESHAQSFIVNARYSVIREWRGGVDWILSGIEKAFILCNLLKSIRTRRCVKGENSCCEKRNSYASEKELIGKELFHLDPLLDGQGGCDGTPSEDKITS